jgi:hypothetical protein
VAGRIGCSRRGRVCVGRSGGVVRSRSPRRSRRARGRKRRRSSAAACRAHPSATPLVEMPLAAPRLFEHERVLAALPPGKLRADRRPARCVPGGLDQQSPHVRVAQLGDRALAATRTRDRSDGTSPTKLMNSSTLATRAKSPTTFVFATVSAAPRSCAFRQIGQSQSSPPACVNRSQSRSP